MNIALQNTPPVYAPRRQPVTPPSATRFGDTPHVHGPNCGHDHHAKPPGNFITQFFNSVYQWFKEALTTLWTDFFGKAKEAHEHTEHCHHPAHEPAKQSQTHAT